MALLLVDELELAQLGKRVWEQEKISVMHILKDLCLAKQSNCSDNLATIDELDCIEARQKLLLDLETADMDACMEEALRQEEFVDECRGGATVVWDDEGENIVDIF